MILDRVTITGADDGVDPMRLVNVSDLLPWVEWGILLSETREGGPRFPSMDWLADLVAIAAERGVDVRLSGHLCGRWARDLVRGRQTWQQERPRVAEHFQRLQLNLGATVLDDVIATEACDALRRLPQNVEEVIFQWPGSAEIMGVALLGAIRAVPLFDRSGGRGILPDTWPMWRGDRCGYAGGLSPDNVVEQLGRIPDAGDVRMWIDVETGVRFDGEFSLPKVERLLEAVAPFVAVAS